MKDYIPYFLQANAGLLLFAVAYLVFLQKESNFLLKRFLILFLLMSAALLPLLSLDAFFIPLASNAASSETTLLPAFIFSSGIPVIDVAPETMGRGTIFFFLYGAVVLLLLMQFLFRLTKLFIYTFTMPLKATIGQVKVYQMNDSTMAFSFLNNIFIGSLAGLEEASKDKIINHELVHCREWHSLDILFTELLRILFWFNPGIYLLKNALIEAHEYRADQLSVETGLEQTYCSLIAKLALNDAGFPMASHFNKSLTLKRIAMIKSDKAKSKWWKLAALIPVVTIFFLSVSCDQQPIAATETAPKEELFTVVEDIAAFPGGMPSLYEYLNNNLKYPETAKNAGLEGKVLVEFVVDKTGEVTNAKVIEGIGGGCDEEALRVIASSPAWQPAQQRGKKVRQRLILPIYFSLGTSAKVEIPSTPMMAGDPLKVEIQKSTNEAKQTVINGVVKLETGEGIPGANIILGGTTMGTVSDLDGTFKLVTDDTRGELFISFVGFTTEKVAF